MDHQVKKEIEKVRLEAQETLLLNGYSAQTLHALETALDHQCANRWSDSDVNGAILKICQLSNEGPRLEVLVKILLKAMMQLPDSDFFVQMMMVPEKMQQLEEVKVLCSLVEALQTARFPDFWVTLRSHVALVSQVAGFEEFARRYILKTVSLAYREISADLLAKYLGLGSAHDLRGAHAVFDEGLAIATEETVQFPSNVENHPKGSRSTGAEVKLDNVAPLVVKMEIEPRFLRETSLSTKQAVERMRGQIQQLSNNQA